jgi:hypothetical protein
MKAANTLVVVVVELVWMVAHVLHNLPAALTGIP